MCFTNKKEIQLNLCFNSKIFFGGIWFYFSVFILNNVTEVLYWVRNTTILWIILCIISYYFTRNIGLSIVIGLVSTILYIFSPRPQFLYKYTFIRK
jgi:hypothetical protein